MALIKEKNRSLLPKTVDSFYVSFYGMPANVANILGRQVKSFERPVINFNSYELNNKNIKQYGNSTLFFETISITFIDDENSLVTHCLYDQLKKQTGVSAPSFEKSKFNINVKCYDSRESVIEQFTLKGCWIAMMQHSELIFSDSTANTITAQIRFDNVDYVFPDYVTEGNIDSEGYLIDSLGNRITDSSGNWILVGQQ